ELVGLAVAVGVFEDANAVELGAGVLGRPEVRVALDDEEPTLRVEVTRDWVDDVRRRGERLDDEPRIRGDGRFLLTKEGGRQEKRESEVAHGGASCGS